MFSNDLQYAVLCCARLCCTLWCHCAHCCTVLYRTVQCNADLEVLLELSLVLTGQLLMLLLELAD